uniref:Homeobox domain-containing protein n=1 Tax=Steinernema glaseri TaxID=37863 RepID=A0A1I7ZEQ2_9BILA
MDQAQGSVNHLYLYFINRNQELEQQVRELKQQVNGLQLQLQLQAYLTTSLAGPLANQGSPPNLFTPLASGSLPPPSTPATNPVPSTNITPPDETPQRLRKRSRISYSPMQRAILEAAFQKNNHLTDETRQELANLTGLDVLQVNKWFQNRRSKKRRQNLSISEELDHKERQRNESFGTDDEEDAMSV